MQYVRPYRQRQAIIFSLLYHLLDIGIPHFGQYQIPNRPKMFHEVFLYVAYLTAKKDIIARIMFKIEH